MTIELGIGMFIYGMIAIFIGATIAYFIINAIQQKEKKEKENENRKHPYN